MDLRFREDIIDLTLDSDSDDAKNGPVKEATVDHGSQSSFTSLPIMAKPQPVAGERMDSGQSQKFVRISQYRDGTFSAPIMAAVQQNMLPLQEVYHQPVTARPPFVEQDQQQENNIEPRSQCGHAAEPKTDLPEIQQLVKPKRELIKTTQGIVIRRDCETNLQTVCGKKIKEVNPNLQSIPRARIRSSPTSANEDSGEDSMRRSKRRRRGAVARASSNLRPEDGPSTLATMLPGMPKTWLTYPFHTRAHLLRNRDIGEPAYMSSVQSSISLRDSYLDTMIRPWSRWNGASRDIIRSAWAPDGLSFVVGSSTDMDPQNQIYNRGKNLLWGDMINHTIAELDEHKIPRPAPETVASQVLTQPDNPGSDLYTTISDICYSSTPGRFYTASYDRTVKVWERSSSTTQPNLKDSIEHANQVNILARCSTGSAEILASAQRSRSRAVTVHHISSSSPPVVLDCDESEKYGLVPTALVWGNFRSGTGNLLAVGYGDDSCEATLRSRGDISLWCVETRAKVAQLQRRLQCVYDLAWHTQIPWLVGATSLKSEKYRGDREAKSNIRIWSPKEGNTTQCDLDCKALDINRILLHPFDTNYISAACTDGAIHFYDLRYPSRLLAKLEHPDTIAELDPAKDREADDFGVQFASWNAAGTLLYTGSSDGMIKQWNPFLNESDAFITNIATFDAGISTGSFSPDFTNLLIGTTKGSMHVLSSAPVTAWKDDGIYGIEKSEHAEDASFRFLPAQSDSRTKSLESISERYR